MFYSIKLKPSSCPRKINLFRDHYVWFGQSRHLVQMYFKTPLNA